MDSAVDRQQLSYQNMNEVYDYSANIKKYKLIGVFQLVFLALCTYTFLTDFRLQEFFIGLALAYFIGTFGIAIFYHRILSHKVIEIKNPVLLSLYCFIGVHSICVGPISWAVNHIQHHLYADTKKDPHSPTNLGWKAMLYWYHTPIGPDQLSKRESLKLLAYAKHLSNPIVVFFEKFYLPVLFSVPVTLVLLFDWTTMVYFWMWPVLYSMHGLLPSVLNHGGLLGGKKLDNQKHQAHNNYILSWIMTPFDRMHANHHQNPQEDDITNRILRKFA